MHGFSYILYDKKNLHESRKVVGKTRGEVYQLLICNQSAYCANSTFSLSNAPRRRAAAPVQLLSSGGAATPSRSNPYYTLFWGANMAMRSCRLTHNHFSPRFSSPPRPSCRRARRQFVFERNSVNILCIYIFCTHNIVQRFICLSLIFSLFLDFVIFIFSLELLLKVWGFKDLAPERLSHFHIH